MSDSNDNNKRRPLKNIPPDGFPVKTGLVWVVIIGAIVALFLLSPTRAPQPATLKIQKVVELAETGQIAEGSIQPDATGGRDWSQLTGKTNEPILKNETGADTNVFVATRRPIDTNLASPL